MLTLNEIRRAAEYLRGRVIRTPLVYSPTFSKLTGAEVFLKLENLQETGSFKLRGASWKIRRLLDRGGVERVVAASAGNHAQGVALAARRAGLPSTVVMPEWASISKQEATRNYGGDVVLSGKNLVESIATAMETMTPGVAFIHPFDDVDILAGQGTISLEILEDLPDPDVVLVPVGGGGLIGGIAAGLRSMRPQTRVVGVQAEACPSAFVSCREGKIVKVEAEKSIADGISVKQIGKIAFECIQKHVERILLVGEDRIAEAILMLLERKKILAEGAGAVPLAALLDGIPDIAPGDKVVLVVSGGNVDSPLLDRVISRGLSHGGRLLRFAVILEDAPGALAALLHLVAEAGANVLRIDHTRTRRDLSLRQTWVEIETETRGHAHAGEVMERLTEAGCAVRRLP